MRTALCLAGQPRFFEKARQLNENTLYAEPRPDIFLHAWHDPQEEGGHYKASSGHGGGPIVPRTEGRLVELFRPVDHRFEDQEPFNVDLRRVDPAQTSEPHLFANWSWPRSIQNVGRLLTEYLATANHSYDWVILTRYDLHLSERLRLESMDPNVMWTLDTGLGTSWALCDQLFVSGLKNMMILFNLFDHMHRYYHERQTFNTERNSHTLFAEYNIPVRLLPIRFEREYALLRGWA